MKHQRFAPLVLVAILIVEPANSFGDEPANKLPPHPRLLLDRAGVEQLKQRITKQPWAKVAWEAIAKSADETLVPLP